METLIRFLTGAAFLMLSFCAFAQANPDPTEDEQAKVLEPISVTGYHIKRIDTEGPVPVVVFAREYFEQAGINTLEDRARSPYRHPNKTPFQVEKVILRIKQEP